MKDYLAARTRFFDQTVVGALRSGVDQVVIGAAGYDGRALRYAKPGVRWFEVDHPATQQDKRDRLARLGLDAGQVRFVPADFTRDPVADLLREAGLKAARPALFLLEGVAVYLERPVLEAVLTQFREVAGAGSRLAISVSLSGYDEAARARFQAWVASMGEPARSTLDAAEAEDLLFRAGWRLAADGDPDDQEAAAATSRRRSVGLLTVSAAPMTAAETGASVAEREAAKTRPCPASRPAASPSLQGHSRCRPCCHRRLSRSRSSSTTRPSTVSRTAPRTSGRPSMATAPGWCRWPCGRPACASSATSPSPSPNWRHLPGRRPTWTACAAGATSPSTARPARATRPAPDAAPSCAPPAKGLRARQAWLPMAGLIEQRWLERFGAAEMARLRDCLSSAGPPARPRAARLPPDPGGEPAVPRP